MSLTEVESEATPGEGAAQHIEGRSPWRLALSRLRRDWVAIIALCVIAAFVGIALAAPLIANTIGHPPEQPFPDKGLTVAGLPTPPSSEFLLGTDELGRDMLTRAVYGARVSLLVGVCATGLATLIGVTLGLVAGYFGGVVDTIIARFLDIVLSFPYLIVALVVAATIGQSILMVIVVIALFSFAAMARVVRGQTLAIKEREYIEAARSLGAGRLRIMFVDVLPNLIAPVLVLATILIPLAIVFEATLSFLGAGVDPRTPSWGSMLQEALDNYRVAWWYLFVPGGLLLSTTLAFNLLGDSVRDALDPRGERTLTKAGK